MCRFISDIEDLNPLNSQARLSAAQLEYDVDHTLPRCVIDYLNALRDYVLVQGRRTVNTSLPARDPQIRSENPPP